MDRSSDAPPKAPRMSIKFGSSKQNGSSDPRRTSPSSTLGKRRRTNALGDDSDSGSDSERSRRGGSGRSRPFEGGNRRDERDRDRGRHRDQDRDGRRRSPRRGAEGIIELGDTPKIIKPPEQGLRNKMRSRVEGRKSASREESNREVEPADEDKEVKWGLTLTKKPEATPSEETKQEAGDTSQTGAEKEPTAQSVEQQALDRLMGKTSDKPEKVIVLSEADAFRRDVREAPPPDSLEADTGIDVTEFGAAMLRGMGWNGEFSRPGFKDVRRRPNQLGLGAKQLKDAEDLGGWDHKGGKGGSRPKRLADYNREKAKDRESRGRDNRDSYKREREREREHERDGRHGRYDRDDRHHHSRR
ncbi:hypothetical protein jhhlp_004648 [Lomentospora prolificans]|uniref:Pre-mRNA-splicing factor n=1 Tax=Lomentospora prolificans TaxID=41688 RepID=A0A2N3NC66_9PEZI|nr:hypothetical protein jhhlp_004648 [Lomentospora prolificans]